MWKSIVSAPDRCLFIYFLLSKTTPIGIFVLEPIPTVSIHFQKSCERTFIHRLNSYEDSMPVTRSANLIYTRMH